VSSSPRAVDALYQGWRVSRLVGSPKENARVVEIGGGLGRGALYARAFGLLDYTLVDLPITAVSSAYFLGRALGPDAIVCFGEEADDSTHRIKLLPPEAFFAAGADYDLVLNVDSLPEVGRETAQRYLGEIASHARLFLSINHEAGPFTVCELLDEADLAEQTQRFPSWIRPGYVEELLTLRS
jgi:putative sugar O-methyltransferase